MARRLREVQGRRGGHQSARLSEWMDPQGWMDGAGGGKELSAWNAFVVRLGCVEKWFGRYLGYVRAVF
jgi:hypothetical protein